MPDAVNIPDLRAREQALAPTRSFIVQAPAGSGKTELLIQRYLGLLATVNEPEEIIAITFTRKAAAEMRERVLRAFADVAAGKAPESEHERRTQELARAALARDGARGWRISDSPARLRIQTIDSLCAALTRQMPMLSKFGSQPESIEDAGALYAEAARATVELIEAKDPAAGLYRAAAGAPRQQRRARRGTAGRNAAPARPLAAPRDGQRARRARGRAGGGAARACSARCKRCCLPGVASCCRRQHAPARNLGLRAACRRCPGAMTPQAGPRSRDLLLTGKGRGAQELTKSDGFPAGAARKAAKQRALALIAGCADDAAVRRARRRAQASTAGLHRGAMAGARSDHRTAQARGGATEAGVPVARPGRLHRGVAARAARARRQRGSDRTRAQARLPDPASADRRVPGHLDQPVRAARAAHRRLDARATGARCSRSAIRCSRSTASAKPRSGCSCERAPRASATSCSSRWSCRPISVRRRASSLG